jgi:hypothetical protein
MQTNEHHLHPDILGSLIPHGVLDYFLHLILCLTRRQHAKPSNFGNRPLADVYEENFVQTNEHHLHPDILGSLIPHGVLDYFLHLILYLTRSQHARPSNFGEKSTTRGCLRRKAVNKSTIARSEMDLGEKRLKCPLKCTK